MVRSSLVSGLFMRRVLPLALMGSADTSSILLSGLEVPDICRSVSIPGLTRFAIISHRPQNYCRSCPYAAAGRGAL